MVWVVSLSSTKLIPRRLTPILTTHVFGVWYGLVIHKVPLAVPVALPHALIDEAAPQCISERTSYRRVRLAFHPLPQVFRTLFNVYRFEPPLHVTGASLCSW